MFSLYLFWHDSLWNFFLLTDKENSMKSVGEGRYIQGDPLNGKQFYFFL